MNTPLHLDVKGVLGLTVKDFIGTRVAVLGSPGWGKSMTNARIIEQLLPHVPIAIIDSHGEYWGLRTKFNLLIAGRSEHADLSIGVEDAGALAEHLYMKRMPVILDLSLMEREEERPAFVGAFFNRLWQLGQTHKKPFNLVIEEAHNFMPEAGKRTPVMKRTLDFALEGRKFGFGFMLTTQSTTQVSKTVLKACEIVFMHHVNFATDAAIYADNLPWDTPQVKRVAMFELTKGEAIVRLSDGRAERVKMLQRESHHVGSTPTLEGTESPSLLPVDGVLIDTVRSAIGGQATLTGATVVAAPDAALVTKLEAAEAENKRLSAQIAVLQHELMVERAARMKAEQINEAVPAQMSLLVSTTEAEQRTRVVRERVTITEREIAESEDYISTRALTIRINRQRQQFDALKAWVQGLTRAQKQIAAATLINPPPKATELAIARASGWQTQTVYKFMFELVRQGLVTRAGRNRATYVYQSNVAHHLNEQYPNLETEALVKELFGALVR